MSWYFSKCAAEMTEGERGADEAEEEACGAQM
jgi:hypothetical protein